MIRIPTPDLKTKRDINAYRLILHLRCRHVTPSSLASSQLPIEIARQVAAILATLTDQELAYEFKAILLYEQDLAARLQLLAESQLPAQGLSTTQGFRTFVAKTVLDLYDAGHHELAEIVVNHLIAGRDVFALDVDELRLGQRLGNEANSLLTSCNTTPSPGDHTWVDKQELPVDRTIVPEPQRRLSNAPEAEAKSVVLENVFNGALVRWNAQDHAAGPYGDPADTALTSSNTGWIVLKKNLPRTVSQQARNDQRILEQVRIDDYFRQGNSHNRRRQQQQHLSGRGELETNTPNQTFIPRYGVTPNIFDLEFIRMETEAEEVAANRNPPLPTLLGDESWMHGIDDFIGQLRRGIPAQHTSQSDSENSHDEDGRNHPTTSAPTPAPASMSSAPRRAPPPPTDGYVPLPHITF